MLGCVFLTCVPAATLPGPAHLPANYNYCIVPESAYDAVLFAAVALITACVVSGRLSAVWTLVAGGLVALSSLESNLGRFGNR